MSWEGFFTFLWILIQAVFWIGALIGAAILAAVIIITMVKEFRRAIRRK